MKPTQQTSIQSPKLIAEVGCNHRGDFDTAVEMIKVAANFCKVDAVKFQKRNSRELLTPEEYDAPHPNPANAYGETYGAHREFLEFDVEQHRGLKAACEEWGVTYSTSVWDVTSAREIAAIEPDFIKIPSACNLNFPLLEYLAVEYGGQIHVSFGMTSHAEEQRIVEFFDQKKRAKDLVIYSCTSGYPIAFEEICLFEIRRLIDTFGESVGAIGFSGHHLGIAADVAAMTLGAQWVERHFTLDRTWKGTDHAASLELQGMWRLARDLRNVSKALAYKESQVLPVEQVQRDKLKRETSKAETA